MDVLSQFVSLLNPNAALTKPISGRGRWGVQYDAYDAPGFTLVLEGEAWVELAGADPLRLSKGDFLLLPTTPAFCLSSEPGMRCVETKPNGSPVRHGAQDGSPDFVSLGGSFEFERVNAPLLLSLLPEAIYIPAEAGRATRFGQLVALLSQECLSDDAGKDLVVQHLLEIVLIEALRWHDDRGEVLPESLGRGLRDSGLARALQALHSDVGTNWSVANLAKIAGMSRSAFASRFGKALGCGPIEYLARWRMALAKRELVSGTKTLDRIAEDIGYESASAFSSAFRKRVGCPPRRFARVGRCPS